MCVLVSFRFSLDTACNAERRIDLQRDYAVCQADAFYLILRGRTYLITSVPPEDIQYA